METLELLRQENTQLRQENISLRQENHLLQEKIILLEKRVQELLDSIQLLEKRLNLNSQNSSKPPSSDGFKKPPRTTSLRNSQPGKSGGQKGHPGQTLQLVPHPDKIELLPLQNCPDCGASLLEAPIEQLIKRQVIDIPAPQVEVTEYQAQKKTCSHCQKSVRSAFPPEVKAPIQYGPRLRSRFVYYQTQHFIPEDRLQTLLQDLYGVSVATASFSQCHQVAFEKLAEQEAAILSLAKDSPVKHLDETGFRVVGKTQWLHTLSTPKVTYYHVSPQRKSLILGLQGVSVHDHYRPYYQLEGVKHALCNQHHLRELKALIENEKEPWAQKMSDFLKLALRHRHRWKEEMIPVERLERLEGLYQNILEEALLFHEAKAPLPQKKRGKLKRRTGHNLALRLKHYQEDVLRFLHDPLVPFTNNEAERDLRMMKCKQKISGGFRSETGAAYFARIRGFIQTAKKQGWDILNTLYALFSGDSLPIPH